MNVKLLRAEWRAVRRASLRLMHNSLSLVGLLSVGVVGVVVSQPEYAHAVGHWILPGGRPEAVAVDTPPVATVDPLAGAIEHPGGEAGRMLGLVVPSDPVAVVDASIAPDRVSHAAATPSPHLVLNREQREAASYLSKKYHVNVDAIAMLVNAAYVTGKDLSLDPLLLLSVMGVESGFNPFAESTAGASGLMQLMSKVHRDKLDDFGGPNIALNPVVNLRVGAVVLKDCIRRGGSLADGLRLYVGAGLGADSGYGLRVLQEKDRLAQAVHGLAPRTRVEPAIRPIPEATDKLVVPEDKLDPKLDARRPAGIVDEGSVASL